jgi:hypothetical protein
MPSDLNLTIMMCSLRTPLMLTCLSPNTWIKQTRNHSTKSDDAKEPDPDNNHTKYLEPSPRLCGLTT